MYEPQKKVYQFHKAFSLSAPDSPNLEGFREVNITCIQEELDELKAAWKAGDIVEMIDALCDLEYVVNGAAVALGVDLSPFFAEVHKNNMTKLAPNGMPMYRDDGKVVKPDNYKPVDLVSIYERIHGGNDQG